MMVEQRKRSTRLDRDLTADYADDTDGEEGHRSNFLSALSAQSAVNCSEKLWRRAHRRSRKNVASRLEKIDHAKAQRRKGAKF
jgi:hypothetical protein